MPIDSQFLWSKMKIYTSPHLPYNSSAKSATKMSKRIGTALVQILACPLFDANLLPKPMLPYCQFDLWEQISVKLKSNCNIFHSRRCTWKCRLWNWVHVVQGWDELTRRICNYDIVCIPSSQSCRPIFMPMGHQWQHILTSCHQKRFPMEIDIKVTVDLNSLVIHFVSLQLLTHDANYSAYGLSMTCFGDIEIHNWTESILLLNIRWCKAQM